MIFAWIAFLLMVGVLLAFDLGVMNKDDHAITVREAFRNTALFATLAIAFGGVVYLAYDHQWLGLGTTPDAIDHATNTGRLALVKYLTGYVVELSLSSDNVFVIALIFSHLRVPTAYQHRVLFWGILGALVMRGSLIAVGATLVARFHWLLYGFGVFLLYTAGKMLFTKGDAAGGPDENALVRFFRRVLPVTDTERGHDFVVKEAGRWMLTPLAICLLLVETTDLLFAFDSIPAIFAITTDPFLVFTSNVFAILGLRSLYFALAGALDRFVHLKTALAIILGIVGAKMLISDWLVETFGTAVNQWLLVLIAAILGGSVVVSLAGERKAKADDKS